MLWTFPANIRLHSFTSTNVSLGIIIDAEFLLTNVTREPIKYLHCVTSADKPPVDKSQVKHSEQCLHDYSLVSESMRTRCFSSTFVSNSFPE